MKTQLKVISGLRENFLDYLSHPIQGRLNRPGVIIFDRSDNLFRENWSESAFGMHIHFSLSTGNGRSENFCSFFYFLPILYMKNRWIDNIRLLSYELKVEIVSLRPNCGSDISPMFVSIRENPKMTHSDSGERPLVGLIPLQKCPLSFGDIREELQNLLIENSSISRHRKLNSLFFSFCQQVFPSFGRQCPHKIIQRNAKAVDSISQERHIIFTNDRNGRDANNIIRDESTIHVMGIGFDFPSDVVFCECSDEMRVKISEVFFTPLKLMDGIIKQTHVLNYPNTRGKMEDKKKPTQKTPKGHEIPIPSRDDFLKDLVKASEPEKKPSRPTRRPKKSRKKG
jgi:hypothetical protein